MTTTVIVLGIAAFASNLFLFWYAKRVQSGEEAAGSLGSDDNSELQGSLHSKNAARLTASVAAELENSGQEQNRPQVEQAAGSSKGAGLSQS